MSVCTVYGPYHTYSVPTGDGGYGRRCECGSPQRYKPSAGKPAVFTDVLVEAEDLRELIEHYRATCAMPDPAGDELADRLEALLD